MWNDLSVDNTLKVEFDAGDCDARPSIYLLKSSDKNINFEILKSQVFRSILGKNEIAEYGSMDEYQQESLTLDIIKEKGIDNVSVQRFVDFYLNRGLSEVNYGRDSQLIDAILLNISSMLEVGYGKEVSVDCENTRLAEICDIFDDNYSMVDENRKPAILSALAIDDYEPNTWRTLTSDEWGYLRWSRPRATELCGVAQVNGVNGIVLLPDNWQNTAEITFVPGFDVNYGAQYFATHQSFTTEQWATMEAAGAVFLPAAGYADSDLTTITNPSYFGRYWSSTPGVCFEFYSREAGREANDLTRAISVRMVKDL
jgi:hypothetical protein